MDDSRPSADITRVERACGWNVLQQVNLQDPTFFSLIEEDGGQTSMIEFYKNK
jgi:hypothetical protein